jgi:hypothetical protein
MAITKKPDGSTDKIYAQNTRHGFSVIDFETHVQTNFINLPDIPAAQQNPFGGVSHGMAITAERPLIRWVPHSSGFAAAFRRRP